MPMRVPILTPGLELPLSVKVREPNLPDYLKSTSVATKAELALVDGMTPAQVQDILNVSNTALLAQVQGIVAGLSGNRGLLVRSATPVSSMTVQHDFDRDGPVSVTVYSLDYETQWEFFEVHMIDRNTIQLAFDDPTAFNALVL